jgi:hypothetical protein
MIAMTVTLQTFVWCNCASQLKPENLLELCVQNLPPAIFTLMKSTEPWMDEYYTFDLEGAMENIGFLNVNSVLTDPRHRTVTGTVPLARH